MIYNVQQIGLLYLLLDGQSRETPHGKIYNVW